MSITGKSILWIAAASVLSFVITVVLEKKFIPLLMRIKMGQTILEIGPRWHKSKEGTPTMGGIFFISAIYITVILMAGYFAIMNNDISLLILLVFMFINGLIGFADDYIKVVKKRNLGLTITQKSIAQIALMLAYLGALFMSGNTFMQIPFVGNVDLKWFFWFFGMAVIYLTVNAVNFTDGVDGLCASVTTTAAIAFIVIAVLKGFFGVGILAASLAGACAGYLIWNWHPSKVMMGDTGSMFLGGMVVALAYAIDAPLIILFLGIIYVIEMLSDVLQIGYFKATGGKRIFKMAPIHHHFEMCGWKEVKIVVVFSLINIVGCIIGVALFYFG